MLRVVVGMGKHPKEETISAYIDGGLSVGDTRRITAHIVECDLCRDVLNALRDVKLLLRASTPPPPLSDGFWEDTIRRMRVDDRERAPAMPVGWPLRRVAAAAGAVALLVGAIVVHPAGVRAPDSRVTAAEEDTLDATDVAQFAREHTETFAAQPLADRERQSLLSADVASFQTADDPSDVAIDAEVPR